MTVSDDDSVISGSGSVRGSALASGTVSLSGTQAGITCIYQKYRQQATSSPLYGDYSYTVVPLANAHSLVSTHALHFKGSDDLPWWVKLIIRIIMY